jgi:acyl carrier protein
MTSDLATHVAHREDILARIRRMLIERIGLEREPDEIDPDTPLFASGLGLDSIDAVEVVISLEELFGVRLPDDVVGRSEMRTVNSLVDLVVKQEVTTRECA